MQSGPIQDLRDEHEGIIIMLDILKKIYIRLQNRDEVKLQHLEKITEFLSNFADKCHHGKEETILFPELVEDKSNTIIINELLGEHKSGRDLIYGILQSVKHYKQGNPYAYHIAANMQVYVSLLTTHIEKENSLLFTAAEKQIPGDVMVLMEKKFEKLEEEIIGKGKHEQYHGWLKELKAAYL